METPSRPAGWREKLAPQPSWCVCSSSDALPVASASALCPWAGDARASALIPVLRRRPAGQSCRLGGMWPHSKPQHPHSWGHPHAPWPGCRAQLNPARPALRPSQLCRVSLLPRAGCTHVQSLLQLHCATAERGGRKAREHRSVCAPSVLTRKRELADRLSPVVVRLFQVVGKIDDTLALLNLVSVFLSSMGSGFTVIQLHGGEKGGHSSSDDASHGLPQLLQTVPAPPTHSPGVTPTRHSTCPTHSPPRSDPTRQHLPPPGTAPACPLHCPSQAAGLGQTLTLASPALGAAAPQGSPAAASLPFSSQPMW